MRDRDLCVTESFAKRFFGSDLELVKDANQHPIEK
jgi:hypothetical protein